MKRLIEYQYPSCESKSIEYLINETVSCDNDIDWYFMHEREAKRFKKSDFKEYMNGHVSICN